MGGDPFSVVYRRVVRVLLPRRVVARVELDARTVGFFLPVVLTLSLSVTVVLGFRRAVSFWTYLPEPALR
jgi:hypothetical protein